MNIIISIIYAPAVFFTLRYFDIQIVSITLFLTSLIWFFIAIRNSLKESLYPLLYLIIAVGAYSLEDFVVLKALPLLVSVIITAVIALSYFNKQSLIVYFAKRFAKHEISSKEEAYIHKSTLFWIGICLINILCHLSVFQSEQLNFWLFYSSVGWYGLFALGGVIQFLHRKFVFLKDSND